MDVGKLWKKSKQSGFVGEQSASHADDLCPACRRNGRVFCPHRPILAIKAELSQALSKTEVFGPSPPNVFVGHFGFR